MPAVLDSILRAGEGKILRQLKRISDQINSVEDDFVAMSDAELRAITDEFRQRYADGESLDDLLPEAFATVREQPDGGREALWLHTSPELAMKRLLVAGAGPVFQLARVWRNGEELGGHRFGDPKPTTLTSYAWAYEW